MITNGCGLACGPGSGASLVPARPAWSPPASAKHAR